jgi:RNA polymerase sigma-70 factor (ECF subfamily)
MNLPDTSIEKKWVLPAQNGDRAAFRQLYRHFLPKIYGYIASRVGGKQEAEDLTSTVFLKVVEHFDRFKNRGEGSFAAWIFTIARNELKQFYRRSRPETPLSNEISHSPNIEGDLQDMERFQQVRAALGRLSDRRAEVVRLRFFGGLRNKEIAALLKLNERTVAAHVSRALEDLRTSLAVSEGQEG